MTPRPWVLARFGLATLAGAGALLASVGLLATSAWLISRAAQHPPVLYLMVAIVAVRAFGLSRGVLRYAERVVSHDASLRLLAAARVTVYERLAALAPAGLHPADRAGATAGARQGPAPADGDGLGLVVGAVDGVADRWPRAVLPMTAAAITGVAATGLEAWLLPAAGAVLLAALLVGGVAAPLVARWASVAAERRAAGARAAMSALTVEILDGLPELTVCGAMPDRLADLRRLDAVLARAAVRSAWTAGLGAALTTLSCGAAVLGGLVLGVAAAAGGRLDPVLVAVVALIPLAAFEPIGALSAAAQQLLRSREDTARLAAVLGVPDPVTDPPRPRAAGGCGLRVAGARTRWPGGALIALPDLDLRPGGRLALLGPSGAGKSTLAAVLLRFLEYEGSVTLGGVELRELSGDRVRAMIGLCAQDAHLFDTTVLENVRLARPAATDAEVAAALRAAGLGPWLAAQPHGLATRVGAHGAAVSGGEHRRLALARALLADVPILVLDEPDAHLDEATADVVLADLLDAAGGRSVLLITHRAAFPGDHPVLRHVDQVITLGPVP